MDNVSDVNNNQNISTNTNNNENLDNPENSIASINVESQFILENSHNFSFISSINLEEIFKKEIFIKEPDWKMLIFEWMTCKIRNFFFANSNFKKVLTDSNILFLEGLLHEYGLYGYELSNTKAFEKFNEGIKLDNQYSLYRMFFILKDEKQCQKFNLKKSSELALIFLIKSCAYNESYLDINRIEPIYTLNSIFIQANRSIEEINKIIENYRLYLSPHVDKEMLEVGVEEEFEKSKTNNMPKSKKSILINPNSKLNLKMDQLEVKYLITFLLLSFPTNIINLKEALQKLEAISNDHYEACFKLACLYYSPMYREHINKDTEKSLKYFEYLESKSYKRSFCSYYKVCEEQKMKDKLHNLIVQAKNLRGYSSHFYANYLCREKTNVKEKKNKIIKYFFKSMLFGNLISVVIVFEILIKLYIADFKRNKTNIDKNNKIIKINSIKSKKKNKERKNSRIIFKIEKKDTEMDIDFDYMESNSIQSENENIFLNFSEEEEDNDVNLEQASDKNEEYWNYFFKNIGITLKEFMRMIFEFVSIQKNDEKLNNTLDYDVLILFFQIHAYYYYKGFLVKQSYEKSIEIMEETFKSGKSIKCFRKIFYYLAKSYKKIGNLDKYNYYMKKSFDIYILLSEFPYHHFIIAKTFLRGIKDVPKNIDHAIHYFLKGYNYSDNNFFINGLYSQKCHQYLLKNSELKNFVNTTVLNSSKIIVENFVDSEIICIICYANIRQVRHSICKHKLICLLCYEKMQNKDQCPFCKQISEANNEFEI